MVEDTVIQFDSHKRLTRKQAKQAIRDCVATSSFKLSKHAQQRMKQRSITMMQIVNCLKKGEVTEDLYMSPHYNGWNTTIEKMTAGRYLRLPVCLTWRQDVLIITAIIE